MADSKSSMTLTADDMNALADRLAVAGHTTRQVDWPALQADLRLASRVLWGLLAQTATAALTILGDAEGC